MQSWGGRVGMTNSQFCDRTPIDFLPERGALPTRKQHGGSQRELLLLCMGARRSAAPFDHARICRATR